MWRSLKANSAIGSPINIIVIANYRDFPSCWQEFENDKCSTLINIDNLSEVFLFNRSAVVILPIRIYEKSFIKLQFPLIAALFIGFFLLIIKWRWWWMYYELWPNAVFCLHQISLQIPNASTQSTDRCHIQYYVGYDFHHGSIPLFNHIFRITSRLIYRFVCVFFCWAIII